MPDPRLAAVVVLAAGEGSRMRSATPKVLHPLCGRPMLGHVLDTAAALEPEHLLVVVGHAREQVAAAAAELAPSAEAVVQAEQNGTGHAVRIALQHLAEQHGELDGTVVVVPGDAPLLTAGTLRELVATHVREQAATTLLTARVPDPTGYGRVVRDDAGQVRAVVEHRDADEAVRRIDEVATSVYAFAGAPLLEALGRLSTDNAQGEEYLTDVVGLHQDGGLGVSAFVAADPLETSGVNDRVQLAEARRLLRDRLVRAAMLAGVTVVDPLTTWLDVDVVLEPDVVVRPGTALEGRTVVRRGAEVGPDTTLVDCEVGEQARVVRCHGTGAVVGPEATVGPFTYLRPGTRLGRGAKAGAYVEVKSAEIGDGSKVPHLSYVGDATIGAGSNIGAGTIVVNYDGVAKHRTTVGDDVRIGSNNSLVAPVTVGDGAYTAAGSTVTVDVPAGALGVGRAQQRNIEGWVERKRGGRKTTTEREPRQ